MSRSLKEAVGPKDPKLPGPRAEGYHGSNGWGNTGYTLKNGADKISVSVMLSLLGGDVCLLSVCVCVCVLKCLNNSKDAPLMEDFL